MRVLSDMCDHIYHVTISIANVQGAVLLVHPKQLCLTICVVNLSKIELKPRPAYNTNVLPKKTETGGTQRGYITRQAHETKFPNLNLSQQMIRMCKVKELEENYSTKSLLFATSYHPSGRSCRYSRVRHKVKHTT